jgi:NADPH-dependent 2,4-dienoyl-CoA reductase/sulfur reductase-like enzyme
VELLPGRRAAAIRPDEKRVVLDDGSERAYGALLIATGAEPVRLPEDVDPGGRALYLRTLADSRAILRAAGGARRAVVLGASFIGLEVAASLRARGLEVHVAAPDAHPLARILGPELGAFVRGVHEEHGVVFHLPRTARRITASGVVLDDGTTLEAELVVAGIGVRPRTALAEAAGLAADRGILVDRYLQTSAPGIFAAGDVARWPDPLTGEGLRIEHWVVAQRQGQAAARNILGHQVPFDAVPFFWSQHYDAAIAYVGHAAEWEGIEVAGSIADRDALVTYRGKGGAILAAATLSRDRESLRLEHAMEARIRAAGRFPGGGEVPAHA